MIDERVSATRRLTNAQITKDSTKGFARQNVGRKTHDKANRDLDASSDDRDSHIDSRID